METLRASSRQFSETREVKEKKQLSCHFPSAMEDAMAAEMGVPWAVPLSRDWHPGAEAPEWDQFSAPEHTEELRGSCLSHCRGKRFWLETGVQSSTSVTVWKMGWQQVTGGAPRGPSSESSLASGKHIVFFAWTVWTQVFVAICIGKAILRYPLF